LTLSGADMAGSKYQAMADALALFLEVTPEPPDRNCFCHLSPPCNDCVEYAGLRDAFEAGRAALAMPEDEPANQLKITGDLTVNAQIGNSAEVDFDCGTWTFQMTSDFSVGKGRYAIIRLDDKEKQ
jgi:hypothetical protein